jgi:hypothetical protein
VVPSTAKCARHVLGVSLWPVRIRPSELLLVNSVRGCGTLKRLQQDVGHFTVERFVRRPSRDPLLDLSFGKPLVGLITVRRRGISKAPSEVSGREDAEAGILVRSPGDLQVMRVERVIHAAPRRNV